MDEHTNDQQPVEEIRVKDQTPQPRASKNSLAIPISIVAGFGLIALAIFFSSDGSSQVPIPGINDKQEAEEPKTAQIRPVDKNDHIRGNPNAAIVLIEYSDYDCPFCKSFHETMNKVMSNYGTDGKVAWVYRHMPLEQLHPSAPHIAQASECVAELGGNEAFWKFSDLVFGERGTNELTNTARLSEFATSAGVSANAYKACMEEGRTKALVDEDLADAINAGGTGTPYTLVLVGGQQGVISGAQPYETVSKILDTLIDEINSAQ